MSKYVSTVIPPDADFLEICRLTDHVQRHTETHLLESGDIKETLYIYENMKDAGEKVYVSCFTAYSFKGFKFRSSCSRLTLTNSGGSVARIEAPEAYLGKDSKFVITIEQPFIPYAVPRDFYVSCREENMVVIKSARQT